MLRMQVGRAHSAHAHAHMHLHKHTPTAHWTGLVVCSCCWHQSEGLSAAVLSCVRACKGGSLVLAVYCSHILCCSRAHASPPCASCCAAFELCAACHCSTGLREASFSSAAQLPDIQDYDNDALVVHMGAFEPPAGPQNQPHTHSKHVAAEGLGATSDSSPPSTPSAAADEHDAVHPLRSKDTADAGAELVGAVDLVKHKAAARGSGARKQKVVHLYAVAAPGMRRVPTSTRDMMQCLSWAAPVELKRQWAQVQKGYFDAPGRLCWSSDVCKRVSLYVCLCVSGMRSG